jgi:hypothetical protein
METVTLNVPTDAAGTTIHVILEVTDSGEPALTRYRMAILHVREKQIIEQIGRDMAAREPWGTLLTNHQRRWSGYAFVESAWSDIITLHDLDQAAGELILSYRPKAARPVVLDEDRYEHWREPENPRYFFRRLMWASLLSGGHATYGGLRTYEPYDGGVRGVQGYFDANRAGKLAGGADDFVHIHRFFADTGLTLVGMEPADALVGGNPHQVKCIGNGDTYIVYAANPHGKKPQTDRPRAERPRVSIRLPQGDYSVRWYNPRTGTWARESTISGPGSRQLEPPELETDGAVCGDWVILVRKKPSPFGGAPGEREGPVALPAPAPAAATWHTMTADWSKNPHPVIGDWGFDRPGYPKGLYLHGVTMPEGHSPANPLPNPIIYDNDEYADADWNDISGEWAVLDNLKNVLGRDSLPFIDDPYRDKFNCGGLLERLKRNNQYNSGHHHKGWGDDAYSDGNIFVAWEPSMYRNAILRTVRGGQVIDHEYNLDWVNRRAIHATSYPFLSNPDAYRNCGCCPEP